MPKCVTAAYQLCTYVGIKQADTDIDIPAPAKTKQVGERKEQRGGESRRASYHD